MVDNNILEIRDDIAMLADMLDRATVIHDDIAQGFIAPINSADKQQDLKKVLMIATANSYNASVKCDIQETILSDAWTIAHRLTEAIKGLKAPCTPSNKERCTAPTEEEAQEHPTKEEVRAEMVTNYMDDICTLVSVIEEKPDFIARMSELKKAARILATRGTPKIIPDEIPMQ